MRLAWLAISLAWCQPITVASGQPWPMAIAVDSALLTWANSDYPTGINSDGKVLVKVKASGQTITVAIGKVNVDALAIDSGALYFATAEAQGTVHRQTLAGPLETIATSQAWAAALAVNASAVYWPSQPTSAVPSIVRYDKSVKTTSAFPVDSVVGLVVDAADTVYWTNGSKAGAVAKRPKGSITTTLAASQLRPWAIVLDGSTLFWVNRDGGTVMSISTQGGNPVTIATGGTEHVGIAVDAQFVYWTDFAKGEVRYAPRAGGAAAILASGQSSPHYLAVDQSAVYWTNYVANGAVMKVARP